MTSTDPSAIRHFFTSSSYYDVANTAGVVLIAVLLVLLLQIEIYRVAGGAAARVRIALLATVAAPLLAAFVAMIAVRLIALLG